MRLLALAVALQLGAGVTTAVLLDERPAPAGAPVERARALPPAPDADLLARRARTAEVEALLAQRSRAVLGRDRAAFLATVDPAATALRARQADVFAALEQVPLGSWAYTVEPTAQAPDPQLDARYGRDAWWAPAVSLSYGLAGFDVRPIAAEHHLTFVKRGGRWLLGADDDFAAVGRETPRALWDRGPVVAVRAEGVLVLGHPESRTLLRNVSRLAAAAVPRVDAVWGRGWAREVVVVVPRDAEEMSGLLGTGTELTRIAAVATAELGSGSAYDPYGDRVLINPTTFTTLSQLGRQVVLTHEVSHVATRRATGPAVPAWLAEGLADHIAYRGVDVPLSISARELRADVQAGRLPERLPVDRDFDGGNPRLAQAYEASWLAVRMLAQQHGDAGVLRFYKAVGAARDVEPEQAVASALRAELRTSPAELVDDWQAALRRQLG